MGSKANAPPKCGVCSEKEAKYRCPNCPVRYCSVACFKTHKSESCTGTITLPSTDPHAEVLAPLGGQGDKVSDSIPSIEKTPASLRPLTSLKWPPEPDPSVFTDPLRKEDPKPLRHSELLRIASSPDLRHLLSSTSLPRILRMLDSLPTPNARSVALARCLGLDQNSLSRPGTDSLVNTRDSPPPLDTLLEALAANGAGQEDNSWESRGDGWYLGIPNTNERIWIGKEERRIMRIWAGVVCQAIDGGGEQGEGEAGWGSGNLAWEV